MMNWLKREGKIAGILAGLSMVTIALGDVTVPQPGTALTWFSNTCFSTKQCGAMSLVDKTGTDIGVAANPLTTGDAGQFAGNPTVQNAAYASGNCVGGFVAVTVADNNGESGFVTNFRVVSVGGGTEVLTVYLFDSNPSASTCTDKSTFTLNSADIDKMIAVPTAMAALAAPTGTAVSVGSVDYTPPRPFVAGGSHASGVKTIYYALVAGGTFTPATTTDLHVRVGAALN